MSRWPGTAGLRATAHRWRPSWGSDDLLTRLEGNEALLVAVRSLLTAAVNENRRITPAGEWLLDNFYLFEEQIRTARRHLPAGHSRELPFLASGPSVGLPRVYDIALQVISHGDGRLDTDALGGLVLAYQAVAQLTPETSGVCRIAQSRGPFAATLQVGVQTIRATSTIRDVARAGHPAGERLETAMTKLINRWTSAFGWAVAMLIVWSLFVPKGLSVWSFALLCLAGPLLLAVGARFWRAQQPSPSIRQIRATLDADERARRGSHAGG